MLETRTRSAEVNWFGWRLVVVGFLALAVSFSVRAVLGLAMPAIARELDWSYTGLSAVGAGALIVMAAASPLAGRVIDLSGPRVLMSSGLLLIGLGAAVVAAASSAFVFAVGFGLVAALGFTAVATNVVASAVAKAFDRGRGLATGIATAGATGGQLLVVPAVAVVMQSGSWRIGFAALAGAAAVLAILAWATLRHNTTGEAARADGDQSLVAGVGELLREPVFHLLFWSFLLCGFTTTGVIETHLLPYAAFCGFPPLPSATAYGVLSAVNLAGMVGAGWLADRVNRPRLLAAIYVGRAFTFLLLIQLAAGTPDLALLYAFAVVFGIFDYSTVPVTVSLAASHLGVARLGLAMGLISGGHALGGAAGAFLGGALRDGLGRYAELWTGSLVLSGVAGVLALLLSNQPPERADARPAIA